jgi:hypothetical protein
VKITRENANQLILELINYDKNDFKKLSQTDRKICMAAIKCFSSKEAEGIDIKSISDKEAFIKFKERIHNILDSETHPRSFSIISFLVKGILNFLGFRIGSRQLRNNINSIKESFLSKNWNQYLERYCTVQSNCDLDKAQIFFLGEQHVDPIQDVIRQNIIHRYANENEKNFLLLEGWFLNENFLTKESEGLLLEGKSLDRERVLKARGRFVEKRSNRRYWGEKKFEVESWENKETYAKARQILNEKKELTKQFFKNNADLKEKLNKLQNSLDNKAEINVLKKQSFELQELREKSLKIDAKLNENEEQDRELTDTRDHDLIKKVREKAFEGKKVFAIAGSLHLLRNQCDDGNNYNIIDSFKVTPCAVIIPKISELGEKICTEFTHQDMYG